MIRGVKETIDKLPILLESLRTFSDKVVLAIEKSRSVIQSELKHEPTIMEACENLQIMAQNACSFVEKVDDLFKHGQSEARLERVKAAIGCNDFNPLIAFVSDLQCYLRDAWQLYIEFDQASRVATCSCVRASENCRHRSGEARRDKKKTRIIGGTVAAGTISAGIIGGVVVSVVAGVFTFGIGTVVGLSLTAAGSFVAGAAVGTTTAVVTHVKASSYQKLVNVFTELDADFVSLGLIAEDMGRKATDVHMKLQLIKEHSINLKVSNHHDKASLCHSLDVLVKIFKETYRDSSECRNQVKKELESYIKL